MLRGMLLDMWDNEERDSRDELHFQTAITYMCLQSGLPGTHVVHRPPGDPTQQLEWQPNSPFSHFRV